MVVFCKIMTWAKGSNIIVDKNQKSPIHVKEKPILNSMTTDSQSELFTNLETDTRDMYVCTTTIYQHSIQVSFAKNLSFHVKYFC